MRCNQYVHEGGGLVVAPGHLSKPESYNQPTASQLLPSQLAAEPHTAKPPTKMGNVANLTHPLFERYGKDWASMLAAGAGVQVLAGQRGRRRRADPASIRRRRAGLDRAKLQGAEGRQGAALDAAAFTPARSRRH